MATNHIKVSVRDNSLQIERRFIQTSLDVTY